MIVAPPVPFRSPKLVELTADLAIVGGGLAGTCAAIAAAREGVKVVIIHDRPVLGGNASSEIRMWICGATCQNGSNNRWAREGGVIDELLLENLHRNPEGNALIGDTVLHEKIANEPNITLLLNTAAFECGKDATDPDRIAWVRGFCSQNSTLYQVDAPLFFDASGDGILGFLSGAAFRMGAENKDEFDEPFAPSGEFGGLLGHTIYFYSKDIGRPVAYTAPSFAIPNIDQRIPRYKNFNIKSQGCQLWWIEWGGRLDTVHESENIKWELWRIVYGVWGFIKNSGKFPDAANLTLEWVGQVPGKRESRRFEGPYMLSQKDIVHRPQHADAVAFGGWSIDLHPADGVYANVAGSHHLHSKGPYQIPFRSYYSRNIKNLFLGGRIISATHVAFGTTRVMATCAHGGQAVGHAAALCKQLNCLPADISADPAKIKALQINLQRSGQHIWGLALTDPADLAQTATVTASSTYRLATLPADGRPWSFEKIPLGQLLHLPAGPVPKVTLQLDVPVAAEIEFTLYTTSRLDHHTPDVVLAQELRTVPSGMNQAVTLAFPVTLTEGRSVFIVVQHVTPPAPGAACAVLRSKQLVTGVVAVNNYRNENTVAVGGFAYPVFSPLRRPEEQNFAISFDPPVEGFAPASVLNCVDHPMHQANAWLADPADPSPRLTLTWATAQTFRCIELSFDTDFDHPIESVLMHHPDRVMPYCIKRYRLLDAAGHVLHECVENHQSRNVITLPASITTAALHLEILEVNQLGVPPAVFAVRCYA